MGITVNTRLLDKEAFNEAMVSGDFNMAFSESWGAPYDPQAFAASWVTMKSEPAREEAWTEILSALVGTQPPPPSPPPRPGPWRDPPRFLPALFNALL